MAREGRTVNAITTGWGFDVTQAPTVTNGAYSAGDIVGGLLTFGSVAQYDGQPLVVTGAGSSARRRSTRADADPLQRGPGQHDEDGQRGLFLAAADAFKLVAAIPLSSFYDHGTPNSWRSEG